MNLEHTFRAARKRWGGNGTGSTSAKTVNLISALDALLIDLEITHFVDVGCGEVSWIEPIAKREGLDYVGVEIVPELVKSIEAKGYKAELLDARHPLKAPPGPQTLIFCRDTLAHLSNTNATKLLADIKATGAQWLLASSYMTATNKDIKDGSFRPLNLRKIPFNLPEPVQTIAEGFEGKSMLLWDLFNV